MININLSPIEERENKLWYLPDLIIFLVILAGIYYGVGFYLETIEDNIASVNQEKRELEENHRRLKPDLDRFERLKKENEQLQKKLNSLKQITISKISRYKPVILLEHLQNLKPEGVWFTYLKDESDSSIIRLTGRSFDSLLVAEFMSALHATKMQELDSTDLRTQVYFSTAYLGKVSIKGAEAQRSRRNRRNDKEYQAFLNTQNKDLTDRGRGGADQGNSSELFPEMDKFPSFEMSILYKERGQEPQDQQEPIENEKK